MLGIKSILPYCLTWDETAVLGDGIESWALAHTFKVDAMCSDGGGLCWAVGLGWDSRVDESVRPLSWSVT